MKSISTYIRPQQHLRVLLCFWAIFLSSFAFISAQEYDISVGDDYGAVVDDTGNLFIWGSLTGSDGSVQQILPANVWAQVSVSRTAGDVAHVLAIRADGTLWAFGSNTRGQLGDGTTTDRPWELDAEDDDTGPTQVGSSDDWVEVSAGEFHSMALNADGELFLWGDNTFGQLAISPIFNDPDQDIRKTPTELTNGLYQSIAAGRSHSHGIRTDGTLWAWGSGGAETDGGPELGILINGQYPVGPVMPTQVGTSSKWVDLFGGYTATFAIRDTSSEIGQLWVWGSGANLGTGGTLHDVPTRVGTGKKWVSVSFSTSSTHGHALGMKSNGKLFGWGINYPDGQLGLPLFDQAGSPIDDNYQLETPTRLESPDLFLAAGAGDGFSAIITTDGFMLTAGRNGVGQLANGQTDNDPNGQDFFENSALGAADLEATALVINTPIQDVEAGETISASLLLRNGGTGAIATDFLLAAVLSPSESFDDNDAIPVMFNGSGATFSVTQDIAASEEVNIALSIDLPTDILQGDYYIVVKADSSDLIFETNEENNAVATETAYEFYADLIFTASTGVDIGTPAVSYDPGDPMTLTLNIENDGSGYIPSGTSFDVRVFLSPDQTSDNSAGVDIISDYTITLTSDFGPGDSISEVMTPVPALPVGLGAGSYFLGGVLDVDLLNYITERSQIVDDFDTILRVDGEANNEFFSDTDLININGIPLDEAVDELGRVFTTDGDATWFGQDAESSPSGLGDAAQSPSIVAGESALFATTFADPVAITFDWRADTSNENNKLIYRVVGGATGAGVNEIFGNTGWLSAQKIVPAGTQVEWVYEEGVDAPDDKVYVDNLEIFTIDMPDLVIDGIDVTSSGLIVESTSVVLNRDRLDLNINSRNQGISTLATDEFVISVYLSRNSIFDRPDGDPITPDDILIRQFTEDEIFTGGVSAVNGLSIDLDPSIEPGNYYLIAYIDDFTDAAGTLIPGTTVDVGQIDEFTTGGFPGEENNIFITATASVEIVALPDLVVTAINPEPDYYFVKDEFGNPNVLDFDFTIANEGLAAVNEDIVIRVLMSTDVNLDPETDYVVLEYNYQNGLSAAGIPGSVVNVDPDGVDIRTDVPIGERLYFGVYIDTAEGIDELNETNNGKTFVDPDFVFSEMSVEQAFDFDDGLDNDANNDENPAYTPDVPWVGQSVDTFDGVDAAMSTNIGNGETSAFETVLFFETDTIVTFRWKVSSQYDIEGRDPLNFYVDDLVTPVTSIAGEVDWTKVSYLLTGGENHTLRWEYAKDSLLSIGQDRGWVDLFTSQVPNLVVESISVDDSVSYTSGDSINTWSVTVTNNGLEDVPNTPSFDVQIRVSDDNTWGNDGDFVLFTLSDNQGLAIGESRTYSEATHGPLTIPGEISLDTFYYLGAYADWSDEDPASGVIPETDESDNVSFTGNADLEIAPAVSLNEGVDEFTLEFDVGGPGGWFGVDDAQVPGGASDGTDAVQAGFTDIAETSYFEALVSGPDTPAILTFDWKVLSNLGVNFLEFSINGVAQERISGDVDWTTVEVFIPAGTQELRWAYRKTGGTGGFADTAWVDNMVLTPVTEPELALTNVNYTAGEYILDVIGIAGQPNEFLGTEYFDITIEAVNQGGAYTGPAFTAADMEVRLSTDRIYGNADDIILGTVGQVEGTLISGGLIRFLGPIQLGDSIPEGCYYPMARIDPNGVVTEYDEENNVWIGEDADVCIKRLPALSIYNEFPSTVTFGSNGARNYLDPRDGADVAFDIDEGIAYYTEGTMRLRFSIQNIGLGRIEGSQSWSTRVSMRGALREDLVGITDAEDYADAFDVTIELGDFTVQELMEGRSDVKPEGDIVDIDIELALPNGGRMNDVIAPDTTIYDYLWILEVDLDSNDEVAQSQIISESPLSALPSGLPWLILDIGEAIGATYDDPATSLSSISGLNSDSSEGMFGLRSQPEATTFAEWQAIYGAGATADELLAYAFNRNPANGDTTGGTFPGTSGITNVGGDDFLSIAFDIVTRADDLRYTVQAADDMGFGVNLVDLAIIEGPYDQLDGPTSLTGTGGLIVGAPLPEDNVLNVLDQGYSARVTIQDNQDITVSPTRFIRVVVIELP